MDERVRRKRNRPLPCLQRRERSWSARGSFKPASFNSTYSDTKSIYFMWKRQSTFRYSLLSVSQRPRQRANALQTPNTRKNSSTACLQRTHANKLACGSDRRSMPRDRVLGKAGIPRKGVIWAFASRSV